MFLTGDIIFNTEKCYYSNFLGRLNIIEPGTKGVISGHSHLFPGSVYVKFFKCTYSSRVLSSKLNTYNFIEVLLLKSKNNNLRIDGNTNI